MLTVLGVEIAIILVLILANGFFAASELAMVSARRGRLELLAASGDTRAQRALQLAENPDHFLATVQVGNSFIGTFAAAFGGARIGDILTLWFASFPVLAPYADSIALGIVVVLITYLSLVLGELVPKRLALQHAERIATVAAPMLSTLATLTRPIVALLSFSVNLVLRLIRQHALPEQTVTQEDIEYMLSEGTQSGAVEAGEAQFIKRVFAFTDRPVRIVMTPRTEHREQ
jgi:putative hemolysin